MPRSAKLILPEKTLDLPIIEGTEAELGIDISQLRNQTGYITLDPAFGNTGACKSAITFIDGERGILRHRGIPIDELAGKHSFAEVAWLLLFGHMPDAGALERFNDKLNDSSPLAEPILKHIDAFPRTAPPMAVLAAALASLEAYHPHLAYPTGAGFEDAAAALMAKITTIAAYIHRWLTGLPYIHPSPELAYCEDFINMLLSDGKTVYEATPEVVQAMNMILVLHADHEQNCSTSTCRVIGSSEASLFAAVTGAVCALSGPLHGGANTAVLMMLDQIHKGGLTAEQYLRQAKDKTSGIKLMGFGHRVYKNFDPRAKILKDQVDKVLSQLKVNDPLLDIARKLEELALKDSYFIDRKLYPNVDFYSGILMRAMGIPTDMFTVMFAVGRMPGWVSHFKEQHEDPGTRIARPRQIYTGRAIVPLRDLLPAGKQTPVAAK